MQINFEEVSPKIKLLKTPFGPVWSGVYLVRGEENVLIDSGASAEVVDRVIVPALAAEKLRVRDIGILLCTHTHGDHIGGHARLRELGVGRIGVFSGGRQKLRDPLFYSRQIRVAFPLDSPPAPAVLTGVEADFTMNDHDLITG
ncbi:MAG: MBL fold metallo-hydrolase, partial [Victivallaceae bacterium]|nr:MBL fold metallo-hydrolase [Victivallaceae bacterium]